MAKLNWQPAYSVKISSIDTQHKKLFEIIEEFYNNLQQKKNSEALLAILIELKKYTVYHFNTEEALMRQYNFIGLKRHKEEHHAFKQEIEKIFKRVKEGEMVLSLTVTSFLEVWIKNHIFRTDMEYSNFLVTRGVQ